MHRRHVFERSVPRTGRDSRPEPSADYAPAARAVVASLPGLLREAEACGAVTLARFLGQALTKAEGVLRRGEE